LQTCCALASRHGETVISFEKVGQGWANCTFTVGEQVLALDWISDTTDALGDLVRAAVHIAAGGAEAVARFDREPAELRVLFQRRWEGVPQQPVLRVRLLEFPDIYADAPDDAGVQRDIIECDPTAFAAAVRSAAAKFRERVDVSGCVDWWGVPFPVRAFAALEAALAAPEPEVR
jgi:hypothetical protein